MLQASKPNKMKSVTSFVPESCPDIDVSKKRTPQAKSFGRRVLTGALMGMMPLASSVAYDYRPSEPAHVEIIDRLPEAHAPETYRNNRVFLSIRGFGREVACEMASRTFPVTSEYGQVACLVINPSNLDVNEIIRALETGLLPMADPDSGELSLVIHAQSAGPKMLLPSIEAFLEKHDNITLELFALDGSPYDNNDLRGKVETFVVDHAEMLNFGQALLVPSQAYSIATMPGRSLFDLDVWQDAHRIASNQRTHGLVKQADAIRSPLPDLTAVTEDDPRLFYLIPENPDVDTLIDTPSAFKKWEKLFGSYGVKLTAINVNSSSHASLIRGGQDTESYINTLEPLFASEFGN